MTAILTTDCTNNTITVSVTDTLGLTTPVGYTQVFNIQVTSTSPVITIVKPRVVPNVYQITANDLGLASLTEGVYNFHIELYDDGEETDEQVELSYFVNCNCSKKLISSVSTNCTSNTVTFNFLNTYSYLYSLSPNAYYEFVITKGCSGTPITLYKALNTGPAITLTAVEINGSSTATSLVDAIYNIVINVKIGSTSTPLVFTLVNTEELCYFIDCTTTCNAINKYDSTSNKEIIYYLMALSNATKCGICDCTKLCQIFTQLNSLIDNDSSNCCD